MDAANATMLLGTPRKDEWGFVKYCTNWCEHQRNRPSGVQGNLPKVLRQLFFLHPSSITRLVAPTTSATHSLATFFKLFWPRWPLRRHLAYRPRYPAARAQWFGRGYPDHYITRRSGEIR